MPLSFRVLGGPGSDNALFVTVDTGQRTSRLLFDCGDGCPHALAVADLLNTEHLFFSHFHMDHVAGFDHFFRINFDRDQPPVSLWVPSNGTEVLHHRFRGYEWNLVGSRQRGTWEVHEIGAEQVRTTRFFTREAFRTGHPAGEEPRDPVIVRGEGYTVEAVQLDHGCPSMGYVVREAARVNVDTVKLAERGFAPGAWLKRLRGPAAQPGEVVAVNGSEHSLAQLQAELLATTPGESIAYLTDFRLNAATQDVLAARLRGVTTVVCESQYIAADVELAEAAMHSTAREVATLAARAGVGRLILFHVSPRYLPARLGELLAEARAVFPNTTFPDGW
ncbi:MBL fold metallo-hydrolase [Gemmata sp.]|uniref:MBL fold metallo-hydrolase n=1 Tax=Gemmata sp. TaxID=1914242 RepID=UPI003F7019DF